MVHLTLGALTSRSSAKTNCNDGAWHYVVGVYDATGLTLNVYVDAVLTNGTLSGSVPASQYSNNGLNLRIGQRANGDVASWFNGNLDDERFYNRALAPYEITNLYNSGSGTEAQ